MDLAQAVATLYRHDAGAKLYITNVYLEGLCPWSYCNWWVRSSTPYLSQSVQKIHQIIINYKAIITEQIFIIDCLRPNPQSIGGPIEISEMVGNKSPKVKPTRALPKEKVLELLLKSTLQASLPKGSLQGLVQRKGRKKSPRVTINHNSKKELFVSGLLVTSISRELVTIILITLMILKEEMKYLTFSKRLGADRVPLD